MQAISRRSRAPHFTDLARFGVHYNLKRAARVVSNHYDRELRAVGLRATQFSLLTCVRVHRGSTVDEFAEQLDVDATTVTRALATLEKRGYVRMTPGEDRRTRIASLTAAGTKKLEEAYPVWRRIQRRYVRGLGRENWLALKAMLDEIHRLAGDD